MEKKWFLFFVLLSILLISFLSFVVSAQTQEEVQSQIKDFFGLPVIKQIIGIIFGVWDLDGISESFEGPSWEKVNDAAQIIIYFIIWFIMFFAFADIIRVFSPFSDWVGWIAGFGIAIVAGQLGAIYKFTSWAAEITAWAGAAAVWVALAFTFILFLFASVGAEWAIRLAAKRKIAQQAMKGELGAAQAASGLQSLRKIQGAAARRRY